MQLIRIRYLLLLIPLILATACRAGPPGGADGPSTSLRTGPTPTPVPPEPGVEQPTYTVQRGTVVRVGVHRPRCPIHEAEGEFTIQGDCLGQEA